MKIDIKEVMDYCHCPMYYYHKHLCSQSSEDSISVIEKYDKELHKTIYAFYSLIQNYESATLSSLKRAWGSAWIGKKRADEMVINNSSSWRDTYEQRRKRGILAIVKFYDKFKDNPGYPVAINAPYEIELGRNLTLTGTWELIREVLTDSGEREIQLVQFKVDDKLHNQIQMEHDLSVTASSYAFRRIFKIKESRSLCYGLDKGKLHQLSREDIQYRYLIHTVKCVAYAIQRKLFYSSPSDKCYGCLYRTRCQQRLNDDKFIKQFTKEDSDVRTRH